MVGFRVDTLVGTKTSVNGAAKDALTCAFFARNLKTAECFSSCT